MYNKRSYTWLLLSIILILTTGFLWAGGQTEKSEQAEAKKLTFSVFFKGNKPFTPPAEDVVADAIRRKGWEINVTDWYHLSGMSWTERFNLFLASDTLPDLVEFPAEIANTIAENADLFWDMEPYIMDPPKTPNLQKWLSPGMIERMKTSDGKFHYIPTRVHPDWTDPVMREKYKDAYLKRATQPWMAISVREDILKKLGYKFKPIAEIEAELAKNPRRLTYNDIKIEPEIKTFTDLENFFKKVQDLNLKSPDGLPVIPYGGSHIGWQLGGAFAFDSFRWLDGKAIGWYGSPYAKEFFKTLNRWARNGWLDRDTFLYSSQTEKIADKIATGRIAAWCGGWLPANARDAEDRLAEIIPGARTRYISVPRWKPDIAPYIEDLRTGPEICMAVNKEYQDVDKLVEYLDWLWSDTAQEIMMWADEETGLFVKKDGKNVFKDQDLWENAIKKGGTTADGRSATYYGFGYSSAFVYRLNTNLWDYNKYYWHNSYPVEYNAREEIKRVAGIPMRATDGTVSLGSKGPASETVANFFWSESWDYHGRLTLAKTDADFEKVWNEVYNRFMEVTKYEKGMQEMAAYFKKYAVK